MFTRFASVLVGATVLAAPAQATQSLDAVTKAAEGFVRAHLPATNLKHYVSAASPDPQLRLAACTKPLETFSHSAAPAGARVTVGVRCSAGNAWTLYVPVTVEVDAPVLVLRRPLARRARVSPTDVEPQVRRLPGFAISFISEIGSLQGHRLKRSLPAGAALTVDVLTPDILGRRGQHVTLIAASGLAIGGTGDQRKG